MALNVEPGSLSVHTGTAGQAIALLDADGVAVALSGPEEREQTLRISKKLAVRDARGSVDGTKMMRDLLLKTDAEGEWHRLSLFPGTYTVEFAGKRHEIEIKAGETVDLDLR